MAVAWSTRRDSRRVADGTARTRWRHIMKSTHLFVLPASLLALTGCGGAPQFDEPEAEVEKAKIVTIAEALAPLPTSARLLAPGVEQALAAQGEGDLTVDIFLSEGTLE